MAGLNVDKIQRMWKMTRRLEKAPARAPAGLSTPQSVRGRQGLIYVQLTEPLVENRLARAIVLDYNLLDDNFPEIAGRNVVVRGSEGYLTKPQKWPTGACGWGPPLGHVIHFIIPDDCGDTSVTSGDRSAGDTQNDDIMDWIKTYWTNES